MYTVRETQKAKGMAILMLIFHHMFLSGGEACRGTWLVSSETVAIIARCARICVYMYVFFTAYGISLGLKKENGVAGGKYVCLRVWKLLAPYWFILVLIWVYYAINPVLSFGTNGYSIKYALLDVIPLADIMGESSHMLGSWYMNFALVEILLLPLIYAMCKRFGALFLVTMLVLFQTIPSAIVSPYGGDYKWYIFSMILGCLMAAYNLFDDIYIRYEKFNIAFKVSINFILLVGAFVAPYYSWYKLSNDMIGIRPLLNSIGALSMICVLFLGVKCKTIVKGLVFLGSISEEIFMSHLIVIQAINVWLDKINYMIARYLVAVTLCVVVGCGVSKMKKYTGYDKLIKNVTDKLKNGTRMVAEEN